MFIKSFLCPSYLYICGLGMLILSLYSAYDLGEMCASEISSSPLVGVVVSIHWLLFTFLGAKIDPGYTRIRKSWFLITLFFLAFILFSSIALNIVALNAYSFLC